MRSSGSSPTSFDGSLGEYAERFSALVSNRRREFVATDSSALLFRMGAETLALPTLCVREVLSSVRLHTIPRAGNNAIVGLAAVRGELIPCVSLSRLLALTASTRFAEAPARLLVLWWHATSLVCPVDAVAGVIRFKKENLSPLPRGVSGSGGLVLGVLETPEGVASVVSVDAVFNAFGAGVFHTS
jgi:chemotaxis-related protein WspD